MDKPLVSVIVPCHNRARYLPEALESLRHQTYTEWECLIVDDGSTDDTPQLVHELAALDSRLRYVQQGNRGPAVARNKGISLSRGEFIQFLDSDDKLECEKIASHVEWLQRHANTDIVYGDVRYFFDSEPQRLCCELDGGDTPWLAQQAEAPGSFLTKLMADNILAINCPLLRKSVIKRVGLFDESLRALEDWDYWVRCAAQGMVFQFLNSKNTLALVRSHGASLSRDQSRTCAAGYAICLKLGSLSRDPKLRLENFETGARFLEEMGGPNRLEQLLKLARANASARVYGYAFLRAVDRRHRLRKLARTLWKPAGRGKNGGQAK